MTLSPNYFDYLSQINVLMYFRICNKVSYCDVQCLCHLLRKDKESLWNKVNLMIKHYNSIGNIHFLNAFLLLVVLLNYN